MASETRERPIGGASSTVRSLSASDGAPLDRTERMAAVFGGSLLVHWGLRRGGLFGLLGAAAGGTLAYMGLNGRAPRRDTGDGRWQVVSAEDYAARFGTPPSSRTADTAGKTGADTAGTTATGTAGRAPGV